MKNDITWERTDNSEQDSSPGKLAGLQSKTFPHSSFLIPHSPGTLESPQSKAPTWRLFEETSVKLPSKGTMITLHRLKDWLDEELAQEKKSSKGSRLHILRAELRAITRVINYINMTYTYIPKEHIKEILEMCNEQLAIQLAERK
jgi:hypothetical protein